MYRKLNYYSAALAMAVLFVTACAVGPNYQRPDIDSPSTFRGAVNPGPNGSLADVPWWSVFRDSALQQLIREALANNYDLRIAVTRIEKERALVSQARADFFPQLGYQTGVTRLGGPQEITVDDSQVPFDDRGKRSTSNAFEAGGSAAWELDLWGRIRRENEAATARLLASEEARRGVVESLVADVASNYFQLRELDNELEIAKRNRDAFSNITNIFAKQKAGGVASNLEVSRSTAMEAAISAAIPQIQLQVTLTENYLCLLLGRNPGPIPRGGTLTDQYTPPEVPAGVPSVLLERRPDVREAEESLIAANAELGVATAGFFPTLDLTAALGVVSPQLSMLTSGGGNFWNVGGALTGPLFQGGRLVARYDEMKAVLQKTQLEYRQAALTAFVDVSDALVSQRRYSEVADQQARQVEALIVASNLARDRYQGGISTYLELLDAQDELFPAEIGLSRTRLQQLESIVQLYKALGGGWMEDEKLPAQRFAAATPPVQPAATTAPRAQQAAAATHLAPRVAPVTYPVQKTVLVTHPAQQVPAATYPVQQAVLVTHPASRTAAATYRVQQTVSLTRPTQQTAAATHPVQQTVPVTHPAPRTASATYLVQQTAAATRPAQQTAPVSRPAIQSAPASHPTRQTAAAPRTAPKPASVTHPVQPTASVSRPAEQSVSGTHTGQQYFSGTPNSNALSPRSPEVLQTTF